MLALLCKTSVDNEVVHHHLLVVSETPFYTDDAETAALMAKAVKAWSDELFDPSDPADTEIIIVSLKDSDLLDAVCGTEVPVQWEENGVVVQSFSKFE